MKIRKGRSEGGQRIGDSSNGEKTNYLEQSFNILTHSSSSFFVRQTSYTWWRESQENKEEIKEVVEVVVVAETKN